MAEETVYEGVKQKERRRKATFFDRVKVLVILGVFLLILVMYNLQPPFVGWSEAFDIATDSLLGFILLIAFILEIVRQLHYFLAEHWAAYNHLWANTIFGGSERRMKRLASDWTRYRASRLLKIGLFLLAIGTAVMILVDGVTNPIDGLLAIPRLIGQYAFFIVYFIFIMTIVVGQFVAIFWFLSRGGIDVVFPEDIETRFSSVWGQDHVLDLVKENVAFLERPDEIEEKGGYIPGGILLWGPPGTGKTLMAEAISGEVGKPFVFVDPGAFIQMFMGVGILKVKRLFRKLRKLSLQHGGVIVFFDEADSLGSRGALPQGGGPFQPYEVPHATTCNGTHFVTDMSNQNLATAFDAEQAAISGDDHGKRGLFPRIIMGAGMGGGGGMGTLQALLTEMSGLKKPRGLSNKLRRTMGMKPKPPPQYRILIMMATNMPNSLDEALLRPGRIDRIYKVGYPSREGRLETFKGYLAKVNHDMSDDDMERLAVQTPYYSGAKIKDMVNEALILAIRDDRETINFDDMWRAKALKELGPPEDAEYVVKERHAVAIHEASHAVAAHLLQSHKKIDFVTIERRGSVGGMVKPMPVEDRFTQWRTEIETDVKVFLASLAGEKMFFGDDNSSGVSGDLRSATYLTTLMEGVYGMGSGLTSFLGTGFTSPNPTDAVVGSRGDKVERRLEELYEEVYELLERHQQDVLRLARVLEERKTIPGDDVIDVLGPPPDTAPRHRLEGFAAADPEREDVPNGKVKAKDKERQGPYL